MRAHVVDGMVDTVVVEDCHHLLIDFERPSLAVGDIADLGNRDKLWHQITLKRLRELAVEQPNSYFFSMVIRIEFLSWV